MSSFLSPYCFGVRRAGQAAKNDFIRQKNVLERIGPHLKPILLEQVKIGQTCVVKLESSMGKGDYNHNFKRAFIRNDVQEHIKDFNEGQLDHYPVLVDCIDVGEYHWVPLTMVKFYDKKSEGCLEPNLFE
jgi:hypothetical protein